MMGIAGVAMHPPAAPIHTLLIVIKIHLDIIRYPDIKKTLPDIKEVHCIIKNLTLTAGNT